MSAVGSALNALDSRDALRRYWRWATPAIAVTVICLMLTNTSLGWTLLYGGLFTGLFSVLAVISTVMVALRHLRQLATLDGPVNEQVDAQVLHLLASSSQKRERWTVLDAAWQLDALCHFGSSMISRSEVEIVGRYLQQCFDDRVGYHRSSVHADDGAVTHTLFAIWTLKLLHNIPARERLGIRRGRHLLGAKRAEQIRNRVIENGTCAYTWDRLYSTGRMSSLAELHAIWSVAWELDCDHSLAQRCPNDIGDFILGVYWSALDGAFSMSPFSARGSLKASLCAVQLLLIHDADALNNCIEDLVAFVNRSWVSLKNYGGYGTRPGATPTIANTAVAVELLRILKRPVSERRKREVLAFVIDFATRRLANHGRIGGVRSYATALAIDILTQYAKLDDENKNRMRLSCADPFLSNVRLWSGSGRVMIPSESQALFGNSRSYCR